MVKRFHIYGEASICIQNELYSNDYFEFVQVDPHYLAIKGGFILPWRSRHEGGVLDENRVFIESSKHVGEWLNIGGGYSLSEDYKVIHEKVVYLGFLLDTGAIS